MFISRVQLPGYELAVRRQWIAAESPVKIGALAGCRTCSG